MDRLTDPGHDTLPSGNAVLVIGAQTGGRFALIATIERPGAEPLLHCHHWEDEVLYVLDGTLAVFCDGVWTQQGSGAAVVLSRGSQHTFAVLTPSARVLTSFVPAGMEGWYREHDAMAPWQNPIEQIIVSAARYGCEISGPHPGQPSAIVSS